AQVTRNRTAKASLGWQRSTQVFSSELSVEASTLHAPSQPSPVAVLPSSHSSPSSTTLFPQVPGEHREGGQLQSAPHRPGHIESDACAPASPPGSQASMPTRRPSPQIARQLLGDAVSQDHPSSFWQSAEHPSPEVWFLSSHCSLS